MTITTALPPRERKAPRLITAEEAARMLNVSTRTITRMCLENRVPATKVGAQWRIDREAFLRKYQIGEDGGLSPWR